MNVEENLDPASAGETAPVAIGAAGRRAATLATRLQQRRPLGAGSTGKSLPILGGASGGTVQRAPFAPTDPEPAWAVPGQSETRPRPAQIFYLPRPQLGGGGERPAPDAAKETEGAEASAAGPKNSDQPLSADARAVADRVYDLMRQEVVLAQLRGGRVPRRR